MHIVLLKRLAVSPSECASERRRSDGIARCELELSKEALELARRDRRRVAHLALLAQLEVELLENLAG